MRTEKGVAVVVYKKPQWKPRYLVLNRKKNWEGWELPKGHLEDDDYEETVYIELGEEAGIPRENVEKIEDLDFVLEWSYKDEDGEKVKREYKAFAVRVSPDTFVDTSGNPSEEHEGGHFFGIDDSKTLLTYDNHKQLLQMAHDHIQR